MTTEYSFAKELSPVAMADARADLRRRQCRNNGAIANCIFWALSSLSDLGATQVPTDRGPVFWTAFAFIFAVTSALFIAQGAALGWYVARFKHPVACWIGFSWLCFIGWKLFFAALPH